MKETETSPDNKLVFEIPLAARTAADTVLDVHVVFTNAASTMQAMEQAAALAKGLHARLRLLVPQVVSYTLPLETPPVLVEFNESRFRRLADRLGVDVHVEIYLCRDANTVITQRLNERSVVLIGGRGNWWWPTREWLLARRLRKLGHEVALVATE